MIFIKINGTALRTVYPEVASSNLVRLALESLPALGRLFSWGGLEWNLRKAHDLAHGRHKTRQHNCRLACLIESPTGGLKVYLTVYSDKKGLGENQGLWKLSLLNDDYGHRPQSLMMLTRSLKSTTPSPVTSEVHPEFEMQSPHDPASVQNPPRFVQSFSVTMAHPEEVQQEPVIGGIKTASPTVLVPI